MGGGVVTPAEYRIRCRTAESCLPPAEYRTLLTALHDDMLAELEALREANNTFATANILPDHLTIVDKAEVDALREVLKALIHLEHNARASGADMGLALDVARAALARAGGEK